MENQTFIITLLSIIASPTAALIGIYLTYKANNSIKQKDVNRQRLTTFYVKFQSFIIQQFEVFPAHDGFLTTDNVPPLLNLLFDNLHNMETESQSLVMELYQAIQMDNEPPLPVPYNPRYPSSDKIFELLIKQIEAEHRALARSLKLPEPPSYI